MYQKNSQQECIPVGCVPPAAAAVWGGVCLSVCWDTPPPGVGLETPPGQTPQPPPWVWAWRPPRQDPSSSTLGVGLETCKACLDTPPGDLQGMLGYHLQGMLGYHPTPPL